MLDIFAYVCYNGGIGQFLPDLFFMRGVTRLDSFTKQIDTLEMVISVQQASYWQKVLHRQPDPKTLNRERLERLYDTCRQYACRSIITGLTSLGQLEPGVTHWYCNKEKFRILARVETKDDASARMIAQKTTRMGPTEVSTTQTVAQVRAFQSYSILTERNLSHYPGEVLRGFSSNVQENMIGYISPMDADTCFLAKTRLELSEYPEYLYDLDDLCDYAERHKTYCQVSVKTRYTVVVRGRKKQRLLLEPDCIICIDDVSEAGRLAAQREQKPILVLHRTADTIMTVEDFLLKAMKDYNVKVVPSLLQV